MHLQKKAQKFGGTLTFWNFGNIRNFGNDAVSQRRFHFFTVFPTKKTIKLS